MSLKRTTVALAAVAIAGLGLTACGGDDKPAAAAAPTSAAVTSAAASAPATPAATKPALPIPSGLPTNVPGVVTGGTTKPADLPADLPLPSGKIASVNGVPGAYIMTFEVPDAVAGLAAYGKALTAAGYDFIGAGAAGAAEKGDVNLMISSTPTTITVTYAKG
ncbi:hypothetical protein ACWEQL_32775 [Kitasatospora sp. NPDC004240]